MGGEGMREGREGKRGGEGGKRWRGGGWKDQLRGVQARTVIM